MSLNLWNLVSVSLIFCLFKATYFSHPNHNINNNIFKLIGLLIVRVKIILINHIIDIVNN